MRDSTIHRLLPKRVLGVLTSESACSVGGVGLTRGRVGSEWRRGRGREYFFWPLAFESSACREMLFRITSCFVLFFLPVIVTVFFTVRTYLFCFCLCSVSVLFFVGFSLPSSAVWGGDTRWQAVEPRQTGERRFVSFILFAVYGGAGAGHMISGYNSSFPFFQKVKGDS